MNTYKVTLIDQEYGDMDPADAVLLTNADEAVSIANSRNETDDELEDGQYWAVRDCSTDEEI